MRGFAALLVAGWLASCGRQDGRVLIPASAEVAVMVRPEALLRSQLRPSEMLSPAFWKLIQAHQNENGTRYWNGQLILGDFWAFMVPEVPNHWFFVYPTPQEVKVETLNPAFRSSPIAGKRFSVGVYNPARQVSAQAAAYLDAYASGRVALWQMPQEVATALDDDSHLLVYTHAAAAGNDSSLFDGKGVVSLYFSEGVARGRMRFLPNPTNHLYGRRLLANTLGMRPLHGDLPGSQLSLSLDKPALQRALRSSRTWRSMSIMADFMGLPATQLTAAAGQDVYAHVTHEGALALASIDKEAETRKALMRMRRNGTLAGDRPPYELMGMDDWSLQSRAGRLEVRQGRAPAVPELVQSAGSGLWARLDSAGLARAAGMLSLHQHPFAKHLLPWVRGAEVSVSSLPDGSYTGQFTFRHRFRLADLMARGEDPVSTFLEE